MAPNLNAFEPAAGAHSTRQNPLGDLRPVSASDNLNSGDPAGAAEAARARLSQDALAGLSSLRSTHRPAPAEASAGGDGVGSKILREADVVGGGFACGALGTIEHAVHLDSTFVKVGASALLASGLTLLQSHDGLVGLAGRAGTIALGGLLARNIISRGSETLHVIADTWTSPTDTGKNRAAIAGVLTPSGATANMLSPVLDPLTQLAGLNEQNPTSGA